MNANGRIVELFEMRRYNNGVDYYSNADFNARLGEVTDVIFHFVVTETSSNPVVTVEILDSSDNESWATVSTPINAQTYSSATVTRFTLSHPFGRFVRIKLSMTGASSGLTAALRASLKNQ